MTRTVLQRRAVVLRVAVSAVVLVDTGAAVCQQEANAFQNVPFTVPLGTGCVTANFCQ